MKFASYDNGHADGELLLINYDADNDRYTGVKQGKSFQYLLDHWQRLRPKLESEYEMLIAGTHTEQQVFESKDLLSPLPRTYQWLDARAYINHVELLRKAKGKVMKDSFKKDPIMSQGAGDNFLPPCKEIHLEDEAWGLDFEAEVAIITGEVPQGVKAYDAGQYIRMFMLVNNFSLRNLMPVELSKGLGFIQGKPACSFSPLAITPSELGIGWDGNKLHYNLISELNGSVFGSPNAGVDMTFDFPTLIAHAAKTRGLASGTIISAGVVSNRDKTVGHSCIVEKRMLEVLEDGQATTPYLRRGDSVSVFMEDSNGRSIFGRIEQTISSLKQ
jgi:fumarylacetoacetate (FAA) hydrolase